MLAIGLQQSQRRADLARPYGYGFEQYVWAMISGVSTFILGAGASVYHGATLLMHPGELESLPTAVAVLGAAGILESKPFVMGAGGVPTDQWPTPHES